MTTDRIHRPRSGSGTRGRLATRGGLGSLVLAGGLALGTAFFGTGCDDVIEEECFEQAGTLTQVTTDTLTVDHLYASLSPDATRILFYTDFFVEPLQEQDDEVKEDGQGDWAIIDVPGPAEQRPPTANLEAVGNARRIDFDERAIGVTRDEFGTELSVLNQFKGRVSWIDNESFVGVLRNSIGFNRLFTWRVAPANAFNDYPAEPLAIIEQDTLLERLNEPVQRVQFHYSSPAVSPNGQWVAYSRYFFNPGPLAFDDSDDVFEQPAIFAANLVDGRVIRVTNGSALEDDPTWSPDGNTIAFVSMGDTGQPEIYRVPFDPTQPAEIRSPNGPVTDGRERLTFTTSALQLPESSFEPTWTRTGQIVFTSTRRTPCTPRRIRNLWIMDGNGSGQRPLVISEEDDKMPFAANYDINVPEADRMIVWSSRRNRDEAFEGQKEDLWVMRGGF